MANAPKQSKVKCNEGIRFEIIQRIGRKTRHAFEQTRHSSREMIGLIEKLLENQFTEALATMKSSMPGSFQPNGTQSFTS